MDEDLISSLADDPDAMLGLVRTVVLTMHSSVAPQLRPEYAAQLEEVSGAIRRLQARGTHVPATLLAEQSRLQEMLEQIEAQGEKLAVVAAGLRQVLGEIGSMPKRPSKRVRGMAGHRPGKVRGNSFEGEGYPPARDNRPMTPASTLRMYIIEYLRQHNGRGVAKDVIDYVGEQLVGQLTEKDLEMRVSANEMVWRNNTKWERQSMVQQGILKPSRKIGIWELADYPNPITP